MTAFSSTLSRNETWQPAGSSTSLLAWPSRMIRASFSTAKVLSSPGLPMNCSEQTQHGLALHDKVRPAGWVSHVSIGAVAERVIHRGEEIRDMEGIIDRDA